MRMLPQHWTDTLKRLGLRRKEKTHKSKRRQRRMSFEALEPRQVLASVSVSDGYSVEGDGFMVFQVSLDEYSESDVYVQYATTDDSAEAGSDYTAASGVVTITAFSEVATIYVDLVDDEVGETQYEYFYLNLSNPSGATLGDSEALGTIEDDDESSITASLSGPSYVGEGSGNTTFSVSLSNPSSQPILVSYSTSNGDGNYYTAAQAGSDYQSSAATITFAASSTLQTFTVPIINDGLDEDDEEEFVVNISGLGGIGTGTSQVEVLIQDNDDPPTATINDVQVTEGNSGTTFAVFTVSLSSVSGKDAAIYFATSNDTAENESGDNDYTHAEATMTIAAGQTVGTISVEVTGDTQLEPDETFFVSLLSGDGASIPLNEKGIGTIVDDDTPEISIADETSISESSGVASFTVSLSHAVASAVTVEYTTSDVTAYTPDDYTGVYGTLTFQPSQTVTTILVPITSDNIDEPSEAFYLNLDNATNGTIVEGQAVGGIIDDDPTPQISVNSPAAVDEGDEVTFIVSLTNPSSSQITVNYATEDVDAIAPDDYTAGSDTLVFSPGETAKTVVVDTIDDSVYDGPNHESFELELSNAVGAAISNDRGVGLIIDDESRPLVSIHAIEELNGLSEGWFSAFKIELSGLADDDVTVEFDTVDDSAVTTGTIKKGTYDFEPGSGTVTITAGETASIVFVKTYDDTINESENNGGIEEFFVNIANPTNADLDTNNDSDIGKIKDNEDERIKGCNSCGCNCKFSVQDTIESVGAAAQTLFLGASYALTYRSYLNPHPIVRVETVEPAGTMPDLIKAELTFGGVTGTPVYYDTTNLQAGDVELFALQADASTLSSGTYDWSMTITRYYGATEVETTFTGQQQVNNRIATEFGNRWSLQELDKLEIQTGVVTLIMGNGSTVPYFEDGSGGYLRPDGFFDTLVKNVDDSYTLTHTDGSQDEFDSSGYLTERVDRLGNATTYSYTSGLLTSATDSFGRTTTFTYTSGLLTKMTDFAGRETTLEYDMSGRLTKVTRPDPDGAGGTEPAVVEYDYDATTSLMTEFTDTRGKVTEYTYDSAQRLKEVDYADSTTKEINPTHTEGLVDLSTGVGTIGNPAPIVLVDDVTPSIVDENSEESFFQTNRFGQYTSYTDALGNNAVYERDPNGQIIKMTLPDPDGGGPLEEVVTEYEYDDAGNLLKVTHPDETTEEWTYESTFNQMTSHTDQLDRVTLYEVDSSTGNLLSVTLVVGQIDDQINQETDDVTTSFTYTAAPQQAGDLPAGLLLTETDPLGRVTEYTYEDDDQEDEFGWLMGVTYAKNTADETNITYEYDAYGNQTAMIDGLGRRTEYEYNNIGWLIGTTLPDPDGAGGQSAPEYTYTYDDAGNRLTETDPLGNVTEYEYDDRGRLVEITLPDPDSPGSGQSSPVVAYTYDDVGRLLTQTDPLSRVTSYVYDAAGRMTTTILPDLDGAGGDDPPELTYTYDALGNVATTTDAEGNTTTYQYDINSRLIKVTLSDPDGQGGMTQPEINYEYDDAGQLISETDALSRETTYEYDDLGRLTKVTLPDLDGAGGAPAPELTYTYDAVGNTLTETDAEGNTTTYEYDNLNRLVKTTLPDPDTSDQDPAPYVTYSYDDAGQLVSQTDELGRTTSYEYDGLGRLVTVTLPDLDGPGGIDPPEMTHAYDAVGNTLTETDAEGNTTTYAYDNLYRLTSITGEDPDGAGVGDPSPVTTFEYDSAGQLTKVTDALSRITSYEYDALGRQTKVILPDLDGIGTGDPAPEMTYTYDLVGNLLTETDAEGNTTTYTYDDLYRLITITEADPDGVGVGVSSPVTTYLYDLAGQLIKITDPHSREIDFIYDVLGRRTSVTLPDPDGTGGPLEAPQTTYTYDLVGNLLTETDALDNVTTYAYDDLYRLVLVTQADPDGTGGSLESPVTAYEYDDAGQLTKIIDPLLRETSFQYDALGRWTKVIQPDPDGAGTGDPSPEIEYAYDLAGNLTSQTDALDNVTTYAYDNLYRLITVTQPDPDGSGTGDPSPVISYEYDLAGQLTTLTDPLSRETSFEYDALGRQTKVIQPDPDGTGTGDPAPETEYAYDLVGNIVSMTDPLENVTTYEYDNLYRRTKTIQPDPDGMGSLDNPETAFTYDAVGNMTSLTDPVGNVTSWVYDGLDRVIEETNELTDTRYFEYDSVGNLTEKTDRNGLVTEYTYDGLYRQTGEVWIDGMTTVNTLEFEYDAASQMTLARDDASLYAYEYDNLGRATQIDALSLTGPAARITQSFNAVGSRTDYHVLHDDGTGLTGLATAEVTEVTKGELAENEVQMSIITWDPEIATGSVVLEREGPYGTITSAPIYKGYFGVGAIGDKYDSALEDDLFFGSDNVSISSVAEETYYTSERDPNPFNEMRRTTVTFEFVGQLAGTNVPFIWGIGNGDDVIVAQGTLVQGHEVVDEIQRVELFDATGGDFSLEFDGEETAQIDYDASASEVEAALEALNGITDVTVTEVAGAQAWLVQFNDETGDVPALEVIGASLYDDFNNTYTYDNLQRLTKIEQTGVTGGNTVAEKRVDFAYNAAGQYTNVARYKDTDGGSTHLVAETDYGYDGIGRLTDLTHTEDTTTFADYDWTFDAASRVTQMDFTSLVGNDGTSGYTYDDTNQVTDADHDFQTDEAYSHDENGNRTVSGYTTGDNNLLFTDGTFNYEYDDEGNRVLKSNISTGDYTEYEWDHRNRLVKITQKNSSDVVTHAVEYTYDVFNRRIAKSIDADGAGGGSAVGESYVYDGDAIVLVFDETGSLTNRYLHGEQVDQILADEDATGDVLWALTDNLGSVRDLVENDGTVVNHITYDAYGAITSETAPAVIHVYAYTGRERDYESDLQFNRARYYAAAIGQWISEDPIYDDYNNPYRYVGNHPTVSTDPSGLAEGHHWVTMWVATTLHRAKLITEEEWHTFAGMYSGKLKGGHNYSSIYNGVSHPEYDLEVADQLLEWKLSGRKDVSARDVVENIWAGKNWDGSKDNEVIKNFTCGVKEDLAKPGSRVRPDGLDVTSDEKVVKKGITSLKKRGKLQKLLVFVSAIGFIGDRIGNVADAADFARILSPDEPSSKGIRNAMQAALRGDKQEFVEHLIKPDHTKGTDPSVLLQLLEEQHFGFAAMWKSAVETSMGKEDQLLREYEDAMLSAVRERQGQSKYEFGIRDIVPSILYVEGRRWTTGDFSSGSISRYTTEYIRECERQQRQE
ncbi:MAG: Calx-beta domain-containing protein [Pirellulaceae bacterium]